jgi:hypothetical protein
LEEGKRKITINIVKITTENIHRGIILILVEKILREVGFLQSFKNCSLK